MIMKKLMKKNALTLFTLCIAISSTFTALAQDQFGGLALYTVRNDMSKDPKATLQTVADIGYKNVEAAGYKDGKYYTMSPEDFKNYLNELEMAFKHFIFYYFTPVSYNRKHWRKCSGREKGPTLVLYRGNCQT